MGWLDFSSKSKKEEKSDTRSSFSWGDNLNATDWQHYTDPRTLIPTILLTTTILVSTRFYRSYLRRIPEASYIRPGFFRKRSLFGTVTRVGDADNFHLFHTPGGRLAGWGWMPGRKKLPEGKDLKNKTVGFTRCCVGVSQFPRAKQTTDPRSNRRRRRTRRSAFWKTGATLFGRSADLAAGIYPESTRARVHLQARSV